jgi:low affinity Fe/Cu permease
MTSSENSSPETDRQRWVRERLEQDPAESGRRRPKHGSSLASSHSDTWGERHWTSRLLHRVGEIAAHSMAGIVAAGLVVAWVVVGLLTKFPHWWEETLYSVTAAVTVVMVFVIQHTNERQTSATQRKLDELIRASTHADDGLIGVEEASDEHLQALAELNMNDRSGVEG